MNFKLNQNDDGKVPYMTKQKTGTIGSSAKIDSVYWIIDHAKGKPFKSEEFPGFPVAVTMETGEEYYFSGEWLMGASEDALGDEKPAEQPEKPQKKRRIKDAVCEM